MFSPIYSYLLNPKQVRCAPTKIFILIGKEALARLEVYLGELFSEISKIPNSNLLIFFYFRPHCQRKHQSIWILNLNSSPSAKQRRFRVSLYPNIDQCVGHFYFLLCLDFLFLSSFGKNALFRASNAYGKNAFHKASSTSIGRQLVHLLVDPLLPYTCITLIWFP